MAKVKSKRRLFHTGPFLPIMLGLIAFAWVALALWEASPYGRYLDHGNWTQAGLAGAICSFLPQGEFVLPLLLYTGGWLLMSSAMMLPTTLPLLDVFRRMTASRPDASALLVLVIGGYLLAWAGFGVGAHLLDIGVNNTVRQSTWLTFNGWALGAAVLVLAGAFQFSSVKYYCLTRCRAPFSFVVSHWHGVSPRREALWLGISHGIFCVGCCWALMLLMFVVGTGSVGWMLVLGAVMALEKNLSGNGWLTRYFGAGLGIVLFAGATLIIATHLGP
jgi:predicted metal-binding membrane protein